MPTPVRSPLFREIDPAATCVTHGSPRRRGDCPECVKEIFTEVGRRALHAALNADNPAGSVCSCCGGRSSLVYLICNPEGLLAPRDEFLEAEADPLEGA